MMIIQRLLFFFPAIFFVYLSIHLMTTSIDLNKAVGADIRSEAFIQGVSDGINNPWLRHSTLRFYFRKILHEHVNQRIWSNSDVFARTLWAQYQFPGTIEIMLVIAHSQNNQQEELRWAKLYAAVLPGDQHAKELLAHALVGHNLGKPLSIEGRW